jgi:hypothetical protein
MDAIREAHTAKSSSQPLIQSDPNTALGRFERSMVMDYEKWHDGIGYDLDLLKGATPEERGEIEALLIQHGVSDWRDVEALAALGTPKANLALGEAKLHADSKIRLAVADYAPNLVSEEERTRTLVSMLRNTSLNSDLSKAIDAAADFHPPEVVAALLRGVQAGSGDAVVHFAALLMFIHGKADSPFDWEQRPFFLRFNTESRTERHAAFLELCQKIGVDPANYE